MTPEWAAFLGQAFLYPSPERLCALAREMEGGEEFARAVEADAAGLEVDYVRLFLDPSGAPCPPWQSVHGVNPQLMGEAHESALGWYREYGVEPKAANEPADHVGLLLTFYGRLLDEEEDGERAARFRREHLEWIPALCAKVGEQARHPFYRMAAERAKTELS